MNKCINFTGYSGEPFNQLEKWLRDNPNITVVSHSHLITSTSFQQLIVIYVDNDTSVKL